MCESGHVSISAPLIIPCGASDKNLDHGHLVSFPVTLLKKIVGPLVAISPGSEASTGELMKRQKGGGGSFSGTCYSNCVEFTRSDPEFMCRGSQQNDFCLYRKSCQSLLLNNLSPIGSFLLLFVDKLLLVWSVLFLSWASTKFQSPLI